MRSPKPWYRLQNRAWYVQVGPVQHYLGPDEEAAKVPKKRRKPPQAVKDEYYRVMADNQKPTERGPVAVLCGRYLDWCEANNAPGTYELHRWHLKSFVDHIGERLSVADLKKHHVTAWLQAAYGNDASDNYKRGAIRVVQRAFNWAVDEGYLDRSPVSRIRKPAATSSDAYITPAQWETLLVEVRKMDSRSKTKSAEPFIDFLTFLRNTGCRPQEARIVEARHVQNGCIDIERQLSKGKLERRVVPLNPTALEIVTRAAENYPTGPLLRNRAGKPWTKDALNSRFHRIQKKLDFSIHAYALRHSFATDAIVNGVNVIALAQILGHRDLKMLNRVYQHVTKRGDYMKAVMLQATGFPLLTTGNAAMPAST